MFDVQQTNLEERTVGNTAAIENDIVLTGKAASDLRRYLLSHETDIMWDENDFGDLQHLFNVVFLRQPTAI